MQYIDKQFTNQTFKGETIGTFVNLPINLNKETGNILTSRVDGIIERLEVSYII